METLNAWEKKNRYRYIYYIPIFQDSLFFRWDELKKSPHLSRNFFFVQAYEAVDQVDFWVVKFVGGKTWKDDVFFLIPNLFGEVVEESLRKRY